MYETTYHRPASVADAASLVASSSEAKLLAGGQTLLPTMKQRLAAPEHLVDIGKLAELKGITVTGDTVTIGAATKHAEVAASADVARAIPALAALAGMIGDPAVRHMGTIGGSVANNDPAADYPAALLALGATVVTNKRSIAADDFFTGLFETALEDGEIITKVSFPIPQKAGYEKFRNPASRYAMCGVFVAKTANGVRVAATGVGSSGAFRVSAMEQALASNWSPEAVASITVPAGDMLSDIHGSSDYRAHLVTVMAKRAVAKAG
ncbi:xanthine dehydrogenase family protein subunit M [Pseudoxanthobacter sp. M-2]|uniref:FAD binding domain-containing protein n=1 Tax=Pseudoxanthobacter sp. M-2 TaxID=3078754 RepID=UPI0038FC1795